jgi:hypothetical protein
VVETTSGRQRHQVRSCWRRGTRWRGRASASGTRTGERGPEEGHRHRSSIVEPATGGRGDQTGRERQVKDGAAAVAVRVNGRYRERGVVAGLANERVNGEGRVMGQGWGADVGRRRELWQRAPRSEAGTVGGGSIGLSPINFIGWEWDDGRYFNFHQHFLSADESYIYLILQ